MLFTKIEISFDLILSKGQFRHAENGHEHGQDDKTDDQPHPQYHGRFEKADKPLNGNPQAFFIGNGALLRACDACSSRRSSLRSAEVKELKTVSLC